MDNKMQDIELDLDGDDLVHDAGLDDVETYNNNKPKLHARKRIDDYLAEKKLAQLFDDYEESDYLF